MAKAADSPDAFKHGKKSDSSVPPLHEGGYKHGLKSDKMDRSVFKGGKCEPASDGDCSMGGMGEY